jgi:ATP-dependent RNA helicase DDX5/DBP2
MLRKIPALTFAICMATVLMSADARAWGAGGWSRSGSVSYTGRYGNTYTRSYSGYGGGYHYGGHRYGGWRGGYYGGGGGYYGGGLRPGSFLAGYAAGVYSSQY